MIHTFQCNSCKGRYQEKVSDGTSYAHVCPPMPAGKKNPERERPDHRDENIAVGPGGKTLGIKSEGAGVRCLTEGGPAEPKWISKLKAQIAKREEKENA